MKLKPPTKPYRVLEIGCGEGKDAVFLARCGYRVTAFDESQAGIDKALLLAEKNGVQVHFFKANALESILALGMLSDAPLATFLSEHPQIHGIKFCLDNDEPGRRATEVLMEKYYGLGYDVENKPPPEGCKDYNEWGASRRKREW